MIFGYKKWINLSKNKNDLGFKEWMLEEFVENVFKCYLFYYF